jgi:hypothetical protein
MYVYSLSSVNESLIRQQERSYDGVYYTCQTAVGPAAEALSVLQGQMSQTYFTFLLVNQRETKFAFV